MLFVAIILVAARCLTTEAQRSQRSVAAVCDRRVLTDMECAALSVEFLSGCENSLCRKEHKEHKDFESFFSVIFAFFVVAAPPCRVPVERGKNPWISFMVGRRLSAVRADE